jgi:geranylgeranyl reductase family protein
VWDVAVVGAGPAGAAAACAAAAAGKRVILLERARIPRYKTCGGGLVGVSLRELPEGAVPPVRSAITAFTFSLHGRFPRTKRSRRPMVHLVQRDEFDAVLVQAARAAGVCVADATAVTGIAEEDGLVRVATRGGGVRARAVVGADGSAGRTAAHVGVVCEEVDLGLEVELPASAEQAAAWQGRILIDWGRIPGSYGWVFPKGDLLSVGVIAARGDPARTRAYLAELLSRLRLSGVQPVISTGHLTRCRAEGSPLSRGRVLVAGDAAGLLDPWTREGISFALRSGALAGRAAAQVAGAASRAAVTEVTAGYAAAVGAALSPEMLAGRRLRRAFARHPWVFHLAVTRLPPAWRVFVAVVCGETTFAVVGRRRLARFALAILAG